jgi:putative ABC transport system permease protein
MSLKDSIQVAVEALVANKLRAGLTMLGIIIGVGAVIALMAVGSGSQKSISDRISGLGANLIFIRRGSSNQGGVRGGSGTAPTLSSADGDAIATLDGVAAVVPSINAGFQVNVAGHNTFARAVAVTPSYATTLNTPVADGVYISDDDVTKNARVVVLGSALADQLFPDGNAVGQQIAAGQGRLLISMRVIGVLAPKGGTSVQSSDNQLFLPITTQQHQFEARQGARNATLVDQITVQAASKGQLAAVKNEINDLLIQRHQVDQPDFTIESQDDLEASINQVSQSMTVLLGAISGISLIVGGIGIMNIMLVSVTERTREIGIRKAVGARAGDIMMQFLTEAVTVTAIGGLTGVIAGVGSAYLLNGRSIAGLGNNIQTVVSWNSVLVAVAVTAAIGVFFGLYPAQRAARLRPIEALRYE